MAEYIEREAVHRMMVGLTRYRWTSPVSTESRATVDADDVNFGVDKIPAADVEPVRHGRWIINPDGYYPYCSECKNEPKGGEMTDYCPNCGAKMDAEVSDNA